jgi:hypothetical protein
VFIKFSKNGYKPRERLVLISQNETLLIWKDPFANKEKHIEVREIHQIVEGINSPGFEKFFKER